VRLHKHRAQACSNCGRKFLYVCRLPLTLQRARSAGAIDTGPNVRDPRSLELQSLAATIDIGPYCDRKLRLEEIKTSMTRLVFELSGYQHIDGRRDEGQID
jgi:hypothetical protein